MISHKVLLLAIVASAAAQYDPAQNSFGLQSRSNLLHGNSRFGTTGFGTQSSSLRGLNTNSNPFNTQFGSNAFSAVDQYNDQDDITQSNLLGTRQFNRNNQFGRQNHLRGSHLNRNNQLNNLGGNFGRNNQFSTIEGSARTISNRNENDGYGQYSYSYETDNGIVREETGGLTGLGTVGVTGSYSYTSPEGIEVVVRYVADENGFQVESPNIPEIPLHAQQQILAAREAKSRGLIDENGNPTGLNSQFRSGQTNFQGTGLQNLVNQNRNFRTGRFNQQSLAHNQGRFSNLHNDQFGQDFGTQSRFGQLNNQRNFGSNLNRGRIGSSQFSSGLNSFGTTDQFVTPSFQNQIASRLSVEQSRNILGRHSDLLASDITSGTNGNIASYRVKN